MHTKKTRLIPRKDGLLLALVSLDILEEEAVGIVPGQEDILENGEHALLTELQILRLHHRAVDQKQPQRVRPVLVHHLHRVRVVLESLGHLLAVVGQHQTVHDEVLEGRLVEQGRRDDEQGVEPAAGLVDALGDKVGGEALLELLLVLEGEVSLSIGHRARFEPAVEYLGDATQWWLARPSRRNSYLAGK